MSEYSDMTAHLRDRKPTSEAAFAGPPGSARAPDIAELSPATLFGAFAEFLDVQHRNARQDMANAAGREDYGTAAKAQGVMQAMATLSISMKNHALYPAMQEAFLKRHAPNKKGQP